MRTVVSSLYTIFKLRAEKKGRRKEGERERRGESERGRGKDCCMHLSVILYVFSNPTFFLFGVCSSVQEL